MLFLKTMKVGTYQFPNIDNRFLKEKKSHIRAPIMMYIETVILHIFYVSVVVSMEWVSFYNRYRVLKEKYLLILIVISIPTK